MSTSALVTAAVVLIPILAVLLARPSRPSRRRVELVRELLFADEDLEAAVLGIHMWGDAKRAVRMLRKGRNADAAALLTPEAVAAAGPAGQLALALAQKRLGDLAGAEATLGALLRQRELDTRARLWAATGLSELGKEPDEEVADEWLGVFGLRSGFPKASA